MNNMKIWINFVIRIADAPRWDHLKAKGQLPEDNQQWEVETPISLLQELGCTLRRNAIVSPCGAQLTEYYQGAWTTYEAWPIDYTSSSLCPTPDDILEYLWSVVRDREIAELMTTYAAEQADAWEPKSRI